MAKVWRVKLGSLPERTDSGFEIEMAKLLERLGWDRSCQYLGKSEPVFDSDRPTDHFARVVLQIEADEVSERFPNPGFYVVANLDPSQSAFLYEEPTAERGASPGDESE